MGRHVLRPIVESLLAGAVDYAGLFPPAALAMSEAVRRYAEARRGADAWLLGRFVVGASRLEELDAELDAMGRREPIDPPWRVSAIAGGDPAADAAAIARFNERQAHGRPRGACVDCVEVKAHTADEVARLVETFPSPSGTWFELAPGPSLEEVLREVAFRGAGAKLRTGGITGDAFPASGTVARFLLAGARAGVRMKATAGLHHACRGPHRLTYEADSPSAVMHGFLNLFLAAALAHQVARRADPAAADETELVELLEEREPQAFVWRDDAVHWRSHRFGVEEVRAVREHFARSFGSCSFDEPVGELKALGLVPSRT